MGEIRIIAGQWRGRRLRVPDSPGLRPTPDRVRETLFNWLMPYLHGARCLDAFAGSGILGLEALSRGAKSVTIIDQASVSVRAIQQAIHELQAEGARVYQAVLPQGLQFEAEPFDIVFLDPPYDQNLLFPFCHYLEVKGFLARQAYIYLEARQRIEDNDLPDHWRIIRTKKAGQVHYHLAYRESRE